MSRGFRKEITARQMTVLTLHLIKHMSFPAIGRKLGVSANYVRTVYRQAEHRLTTADRRKEFVAALAAAAREDDQ